MKRIVVLNALRQIAESLGYRCAVGREEVLAPVAGALPAVWVTSLRLAKTEGRVQRRDTYAVRLRWIAASGADQEQEVFHTLERDAARLYGELGTAAEVRCTEGLKLTPDAKPLVPRGAVSVTAEFEAVVYYRNGEE